MQGRRRKREWGRVRGRTRGVRRAIVVAAARADGESHDGGLPLRTATLAARRSSRRVPASIAGPDRNQDDDTRNARGDHGDTHATSCGSETREIESKLASRESTPAAGSRCRCAHRSIGSRACGRIVHSDSQFRGSIPVTASKPIDFLPGGSRRAVRGASSNGSTPGREALVLHRGSREPQHARGKGRSPLPATRGCDAPLRPTPESNGRGARGALHRQLLAWGSPPAGGGRIERTTDS